MQHAPITHQERWEENAGYSPSTLAAVISGLICAAEMARAHDAMEMAVFLRGVRRLDRAPSGGLDGHQQRRAASGDQAALHAHPAAGERAKRTPAKDCGTEMIHINNRPPGERTEFEAREDYRCAAFWSWCDMACDARTIR